VERVIQSAVPDVLVQPVVTDVPPLALNDGGGQGFVWPNPRLGRTAAPAKPAEVTKNCLRFIKDAPTAESSYPADEGPSTAAARRM